jgi:isopentenyldiphosphate isomerase
VPIDDPTELFDLCDADGRPLGRARARGLVHRDGDWHRSLHVWVILEAEAGPAVLFQRRSLTKDTHPGKVDASVAGHVRAGETVEASLREAEEEIGLAVGPSDVVRLGLRRHVSHRPPSHSDRELQDIFYVTTRRPLESLRPDPDEVLGLIAVALPAALALCAGEVQSVAARELTREGVKDVVLGAGELLPVDDGYFVVVLTSIAQHLAKVAHPASLEEGLTGRRGEKETG